MAAPETTGRSGTALHVVGLGPGDPSLLTPEAAHILQRVSVIAGYSGYIDLVPSVYLEGKRVISTGMTGEVARANAAVDAALAGEPTAVVCSGDPGVYALSGLVLEILEGRGVNPDALPFRVSPGVPAVCAAAALLGAPLMHDFACISLSDLLTPWERILNRLEHAFAADFVVALYNPRSRKRSGHLADALAIALRHREAACPVGVVRNAFRPDQRVSVTRLDQCDPEDADMFTIVLVGNSTSRVVPGGGGTPLAWDSGARILTPRGYSEKYSNLLCEKNRQLSDRSNAAG